MVHIWARQGFTTESFFNGKQSTPSMHGAAEHAKGLEAAIRRQLGLE